MTVREFAPLYFNMKPAIAETYPMHVVCAWIDNSESVAKKHYLQVTGEHFAKAARQTTRAGAVSSNPEQSGETVDPGKGRENAKNPVLVTTASSPGRTRTYDKPVNSRLLYQLSYRGSRTKYPSFSRRQ